MTEREAIEAILQRWKTGWQVLHPGSANDTDTPLDINEPLCVPWTTSNEIWPTELLGALGAWARISVDFTTSQQTTLGTPSKDEYRGNVFVQLFGPLGSGDGLLADLAEDARRVLHKKRIGELNLYVGRSEPGASDGRWAMRVVVIPFRYEHES